MATSTVVLRYLASAEVDGEVYGTISATAKLAQLAVMAGNRVKVVQVAAALRRANKHLESFFERVDEAFEEESSGNAARQAAEVSPQKIQQLADNLDHLARMIEYQYENMRRVGFTNNSLIAEPLKKLKSNVEPLKDLADWLDVAAKPEQLKAIVARAREEKERGELLDLDRVG